MKWIALALFILLPASSRAQTAQGVDLRTVRSVLISTGTGVADAGTIRTVPASNSPAMAVTISSVAVYSAAGSSVVIRCTDALGAVISCGSSTVTGGFTYISLSIPVSGGTGEAAFSSTGTLRQCSTSVPLGSVYDLEIASNDADQFPIFGRAGIAGRAGLIGARFLLGAYKMTISSATIDGTYKALCVIML